MHRIFYNHISLRHISRLVSVLFVVSLLSVCADGQRRRTIVTDLPELLVKSHKGKMLHLLGYVREYSTLSSYTDTVFLFREKMVDFMLPTDKKMRFKGWSVPRVIKSRSYYRFTDAYGLDSVSDESNYHFSWSDWMGMVPPEKLPPTLRTIENGTDTLYGKYSPAEIWTKKGEEVAVDLNVLADTTVRKWVPNLSVFFRRNMDFESFRLRFDYDNVTSGMVSPLDLTRYTFSIDSKERGHSMFRFNRPGEPYYVTTTAEVYILDREFITVKEAKKWQGHDFTEDDIAIYQPSCAPSLEPQTVALMERVDGLNKNGIRLSLAPDERLGGIDGSNTNYQIGNRLLFLIKDITGIGKLLGKRNVEKKWKKFKRGIIEKNPTRIQRLPASPAETHSADSTKLKEPSAADKGITF